VQYGGQVPTLYSAVWWTGTNIIECSMLERYQHYRVQYGGQVPTLQSVVWWTGTNIIEFSMVDRY